MTAYQKDIVWRCVFAFAYIHYAAAIGVYYCVTAASWKTLLWTYTLMTLSTIATGAGVHRLWSHRCYKARLPLRIFLAIFQTMSFQNTIHHWARDHRVHHKAVDTDADPHNSSRGFFFCHMGWMMIRKLPEVKNKGSTIDLSDLEEDSVVVFQRDYYPILVIFACFIVPTIVPWYFWGEDAYIAWCIAANLRYVVTLHQTWSINSAAHFFGSKPYDKNIRPTENLFVSVVTNGEGWHNYHHTFPWDYKAEELGRYGTNLSMAFIDLMSILGLAYDLKSVSNEIIKRRMERTGKVAIKEESLEEEPIWGWGDKDMEETDKNFANIIKAQ